ncbi:MAG: hypothetical protein CMK37_08355 [Porticoccaceae bacterium]|nr:hypothetical protein [Porticoccaceae bacterium]|tara:strand:- start:3151 stop:3687 length:537 start_codon:yes stop_codon:yes gene_type:complete
MAQITVNDLTEIGSADPNDFLLIWDSSAGATRKIRVSNLLGSSTGSSLSSGVPVIIRGQMSDIAKMTNIVRGVMKASSRQKAETKTLSTQNMFAVNSVVTGQIDDGVSITKSAGEETVYINNVAITVGGASKEVTIVNRRHSYRNDQTTPYKATVSISQEQIVLVTGAYMNYNIQVYA